MPFLFNHAATRPPTTSFIVVGEKSIPLIFRHNPRAKRYVLRLTLDGAARMTIPRGGCPTKAREFAEKQVGWIERQLARVATRPVGPPAWPIGSEILFRGEAVIIAAGFGDPTRITFADQALCVAQLDQDHRPAIQRHLHRLAASELPPKVFQLAEQQGLKVRQVVVRNQKSRWGSCSTTGTISLNWRLIQAPPFVADYVLIHELMHLREMNHSVQFWQQVERAFPDFREAKKWLKLQARLLR